MEEFSCISIDIKVLFVHRMAGCWKDWGEKNRYFDTPDDAAALYVRSRYEKKVHQLLLEQDIVSLPSFAFWTHLGRSWPMCSSSA